MQTCEEIKQNLRTTPSMRTVDQTREDRRRQKKTESSTNVTAEVEGAAAGFKSTTSDRNFMADGTLRQSINRK